MVGQPRPSSPILVADADPDTCQTVRAQLQQAGYSTECAASGEEAPRDREEGEARAVHREDARAIPGLVEGLREDTYPCHDREGA